MTLIPSAEWIFSSCLGFFFLGFSSRRNFIFYAALTSIAKERNRVFFLLIFLVKDLPFCGLRGWICLDGRICVFHGAVTFDSDDTIPKEMKRVRKWKRNNGAMKSDMRIIRSGQRTVVLWLVTCLAD